MTDHPHPLAGAVKPLHWTKHPDGSHWSALTTMGMLYLATSEGWLPNGDQGGWREADNLDAAKAAAQADYAARILSALAPTLADEVVRLRECSEALATLLVQANGVEPRDDALRLSVRRVARQALSAPTPPAMRCAECNCERGGAECNWIATPPADVVGLVERMEQIVNYRYSSRDVMIHDCALGQITMGDVMDLCKTVTALSARVAELEGENARLSRDLAVAEKMATDANDSYSDLHEALVSAEAAADRRAGICDDREKDRRMREIMRPSPIVYDGGNLADAIAVMLKATEPKIVGSQRSHP